MSLNKVLLGLILSLIIFPTAVNAEIATTRDWIGFFPAGVDDNTKSGTVTVTADSTYIDGHAWVYATNCSQTAPGASAIPKLQDRDPLAACKFANFSPALTPGQFYILRMYGNNYNPTSNPKDIAGLIATSKTIQMGGTNSYEPGPPNPSSKLYFIKKNPSVPGDNGDLTINSNMTVNYTGIIFVEGDLYINTNLTNTNQNTGLVFIVQGNINIKSTVTQVDAFLVTNKVFCSSWDTATSSCINSASPVQLTINGSVVALSSDNADKPLFKRSIGDNSSPAEIITYAPKYLVILKDTFARDRLIWNEIQ